MKICYVKKLFHLAFSVWKKERKSFSLEKKLLQREFDKMAKKKRKEERLKDME